MLGVENCDQLSDAGFGRALRQGQLSKLYFLSADNCSNIGIEMLSALSECTPLLQDLFVNKCKCVTDKAVALVAQYCTQASCIVSLSQHTSYIV